jgi:hypothetical protein
MGAALTYARRYALFTLVGIAGEDDLDAPDLNLKVEPAPKVDAARTIDADPLQPIQSNDSGSETQTANSTLGRRDKSIRTARATLDAEQSAAMRQQLLADVAQLQSADEAAEWAHKNLPAKNTLTTADADLVENAFRDRLAVMEPEPVSFEEPTESNIGEASAMVSGPRPFIVPTEASATASIILRQTQGGRRRPVAVKSIRLRDKEHCKFVTTQPCVACGRTPSEAHHIRFAQPRALGRKVSDEYTVPVCRLHHRELHRYGDEASWWAGVSIDPMPIALELWRCSRLAHPRSLSSSPDGDSGGEGR